MPTTTQSLADPAVSTRPVQMLYILFIIVPDRQAEGAARTAPREELGTHQNSEPAGLAAEELGTGEPAARRETHARKAPALIVHVALLHEVWGECRWGGPSGLALCRRAL